MTFLVNQFQRASIDEGITTAKNSVPADDTMSEAGSPPKEKNSSPNKLPRTESLPPIEVRSLISTVRFLLNVFLGCYQGSKQTCAGGYPFDCCWHFHLTTSVCSYGMEDSVLLLQ